MPSEDSAARIAELEREVARLRRQLEDGDPGAKGRSRGGSMTRRTALAGLGAAGLLGLGAGTASADPRGQVGTSADPLRKLYTEALNGGVTSGTELTDLVGSGLAINAGSLEVSGVSEWTDADANDLLEPSDGSKTGIEVTDVRTDTLADNGSGDVRLGNTLDLSGQNLEDETTTIWDASGLGENLVDTNAIQNDAVTVAELATPFADLASLFGSKITAGGTLDLAGNPITGGTAIIGRSELMLYTDESNRTLELGVPEADGGGRTAGGNVVAGHPNNTVNNSAAGVVIGGGGNEVSGSENTVGEDYTTVGGGRGNDATGIDATVGGGERNTASGSKATVGGGVANLADTYATIGGGYHNKASSRAATVGGGHDNRAKDESATVAGGGTNEVAGRYATIGGGNHNRAKSENTTVGGGEMNEVTGRYATIGGGNHNRAEGDNATVAGGHGNRAGEDSATVAGGGGNIASGYLATVPGGGHNKASGQYSFAAGRYAETESSGGPIWNGSFVWGDGSSNTVRADTSNQVVFQAGGGMKVYSDSDTSTNTGVELPGGSGSWASLSTRTAKSDVEAVNPPDALDAVDSLDIATWRYDAEDDDVRHMGPMAEDFHDAFGLGEDERRISNVDADGVALAAIQGLSAKLDERDECIEGLKAALDAKDARIDDQRDRINRLEEVVDRKDARIDDLDARLAALEDTVTGETGGEHR